MHAVRVSETGGPEQLVWTEVPTPEPGPGQALVRVAAAGLNFIDVYQRMGLYPLEVPFTPGQEGAGTVEAVGPDTDLATGSRLAWTDVLGSYGEFALVPADRAVAVPADIDLDDAAAVMLQGVTAHYLSNDTFALAEGQHCLIHAGAGGVGRLLIQMAKMKGAVVVATAGTREKADLAQSAGADHVILYEESDFGDEVNAILGEKQLDVIYDGVGAATIERGLELLRPRGMMVSFGNASGRPPSIDPLVLMRHGSLYLTRPTMFHYVATREQLTNRAGDLFDWISKGRLEVLVGSRYPMSEAAQAHRALEARKTVGKVLLDP